MARLLLEESILSNPLLRRPKMDMEAYSTTSSYTMSGDEPSYFEVDATSTSINITLPTRAATNDGQVRFVVNQSSGSAVLTIKDGATTLTTLNPGEVALCLAGNTAGALSTRLWKSTTLRVDSANTAQTYLLTVFLGALADVVGTSTTKVAIPHAFKVTAASFRAVTRSPTTASKAFTLQIGISGVTVSGGLLTVSTAGITQVGTAYAFSAITGSNTGAAASTLELAVSSLTTFAEGNGEVEFTIVRT